MVVTASLAVKVGAGFGIVSVAADQVGSDRAALYTAFGGVLVALIGGVFAFASSRRNTPAPPMEATTHALPRELIELHEEERDRLIAERDQYREERDEWMQRAYEKGWTP